MSRIRTVKPELFKHEALFEAEQVSGLPLRLAFIALFSCCDCEGRFRWQPRRLKLDLLPYDDEIDLSAVLDALAQYGFIKRYTYEGEYYGCIPSWSRHQHCNHREPESELPSWEESLALQSKHASNTNSPMDQTSQDPRAEILVNDAGACPGTPGGKGKGREREEEQEGEGNGSLVAPARRVGGIQNPIQKIFEHWQQVMDHPQAQLDPKREALIRKALSLGYTLEQLCAAITGCSLTPHNQGDNEKGQRYDGLHIILRDAEQIDRFLHNAHNPPRPLSTADRLSRSNGAVLQRWAHQNVFEETLDETQ